MENVVKHRLFFQNVNVNVTTKTFCQNKMLNTKNALREASREKFERDIYSLKDMYTLREITTTHAQSIKELQFQHYYLF